MSTTKMMQTMTNDRRIKAEVVLESILKNEDSSYQRKRQADWGRNEKQEFGMR